MATIRQTSFAAGELSPRLWGRTDLSLFGAGARRLRNFFVSPQGAAVSRPGTQLLVQAKTADVVLLPFVYSDTESYVLELGARYLRVHHSVTGYTGIELVTPYAAADLPALQWAQAGSILTLTHESYAPKELHSPVLVAGLPTPWSLQDCRFGPPSDGATGASMQAFFVKMDGSAAPVPHLVPEPRTRPLSELFVVDAAHPPREWRWKVSALVQHNLTGELAETLPRDITEYSDGVTTATRAPIPSDSLVVLAADKPVRLSFPGFATAIPKPANWTVVGLVWYRGRGGLFGFIGTTRWAQDFIDTGVDPNYARQPLRGDSPFTLDERPAAVAYFQQRRVFAGSLAHPSTLWASATDDWGNHDRPFPPFLTDDAPIEASFVSRRREAIRSLVTHRRALVLTDSSVWSAGGGDAGAVTPSTLELRLEDEVGATKLQPLVVDGAVLYVRAKGRGVRALSLTDGGAYQARDISWHAEHLFRGADSEIVSWCFQRDPWATIWAAQADGSLLSCCRTGEGIWAWAKSTTSSDKVLSVACVPEAGADVVVLAVKRGGATYLERMTTRDIETANPLSVGGDASFAVDCFSMHDVAVAAAATITGLARFEGRDVWAVAPGNAPQGPLRVSGGEVTVGPFEEANEGSVVRVLVGLAFVAELELLDAVAAGRTTLKATDTVGFEVDAAQGLEVGEDFEHLAPWRSRTPADSYEFPSAASAFVVVKVRGAWRRTGRAVLRQSKPLPVTVLGITRELDVGGS